MNKNRLANLAVAVIVAMLTAGAFVALADVAPAQCPLICLRDQASIELASTAYFYQGDSVEMAGSVMYTGATTNTSVQDLTGCTITQVLGNASITVTNAGSITTATSGVFTVTGTVPAVNPCYIQITVTDSNGVSYTYQHLQIRTKVKL
jgi:hypothetical protein